MVNIDLCVDVLQYTVYNTIVMSKCVVLTESLHSTLRRLLTYCGRTDPPLSVLVKSLQA